MEIVGAKPARKYTDGKGKTHIERTNPAGVDFVVDTVEIFLASSQYHTIIVGAFSGSNPFTSQDSVSLGTVLLGVAGYHTYTGLSVDFSAGDRIGAFDNESLSLALPLGSGFAYAGNAFDAGAVTFGNAYGCLIYGSGEIAAVGSKAFMHYYKNMMAGVERC